MSGSDISAAARWLSPDRHLGHAAAAGQRRSVTPPWSGGVSIILIAICSATVAATDPSDRCIEAAHHAAGRTDVPVDVLLAISLTETGRDGRPWPWTVNMQGAGRWFTTRQEARAFAEAGRSRGARSFDIGCFQINHRWHGENFASIDAMFDPRQNALYAAAFLQALHDETGSWSAAAGAYHSRTEVHAARYRAAFEANLERVAGLSRPGGADPDSPQEPVIVTRSNPFPLLRQVEGGGSLGSLVPLAAGG